MNEKTYPSAGASVGLTSSARLEAVPDHSSLAVLSRAEAGARVQRLRLRLGELQRGFEAVDRLAREVLGLVVELHEGRAWISFGLPDWDSLVEAQRLRLPVLGPDEELAAVRFLLENHLTHRAIRKVTGVSSATVSRRRAALVAQGVTLPDRVRSLDGKNRKVAKAEPGSIFGEVLHGQLVLPVESSREPASAAEVEAFLLSVAAAPVLPADVVAKLRSALEDGLLPAMEQLESTVASGAVLPARVRESIRALDGKVELAYRRWRDVSARGTV